MRVLVALGLLLVLALPVYAQEADEVPLSDEATEVVALTAPSHRWPSTWVVEPALQDALTLLSYVPEGAALIDKIGTYNIAIRVGSRSNLEAGSLYGHLIYVSPLVTRTDEQAAVLAHELTHMTQPLTVFPYMKCVDAEIQAYQVGARFWKLLRTAPSEWADKLLWLSDPQLVSSWHPTPQEVGCP